MADFPALPLWTDAYLADTTHLTFEEHGRYMLALIHLWRMPKRRFPNDTAWLARKFRCSQEEVETCFMPLFDEFFRTDGNWLFHKRIEKEFARVSASSQKQSERAKSRHEKEKALCHGSAGVALQPDPDPDPDPDPERKKDPLRDQKKESDAPPMAAADNKPARGSRISDAWKPSEADREFGREHGLSDPEIDAAADEFRDYWRGVSGQRGTKLDWSATWRNQIRFVVEKRNKPRYQAKTKRSITDTLSEIINIGVTIDGESSSSVSRPMPRLISDVRRSGCGPDTPQGRDIY